MGHVFAARQQPGQQGEGSLVVQAGLLGYLWGGGHLGNTEEHALHLENRNVNL